MVSFCEAFYLQANSRISLSLASMAIGNASNQLLMAHTQPKALEVSGVQQCFSHTTRATKVPGKGKIRDTCGVDATATTYRTTSECMMALSGSNFSSKDHAAIPILRVLTASRASVLTACTPHFLRNTDTQLPPLLHHTIQNVRTLGA